VPPPRSDSSFGAEEETRFDRSTAALSLEGINGPLEGNIFGSDGWTITLGRSSGCAIMLPVKESSRTHARIDYDRGRFWISDLKTLNGTRLNGRLVDEPTALEDGDRVSICGQHFAVHLHRIPGRVLVSDHFEESPFVERQGKSTSSLRTEPQLVSGDSAPLRRWLVAGAVLLLLFVGIGIVGWRWLAQRPDRRPRLGQDARPTRQTAPQASKTSGSINLAHQPEVQPLPFPATLEPQGLVTVESESEGVVRELTPRGTRVGVHERLALIERDSPLAQKKLARLRELTRKYGSSEEYADFIDQAKQDYERETKVPIEVQSPTSGIVIASRVKVGQSIRRGDPVAELAATVRLTVDNGVVEGPERLCRVVLLERADASVSGRLLDPSDGEHGRTRTLELFRLPAGIARGAVGRVRVDCNR